MTSSQQRAELQRRIWQIANDVRGAVDGWDFKQYVLGTLFYRLARSKSKCNPFQEIMLHGKKVHTESFA